MISRYFPSFLSKNLQKPQKIFIFSNPIPAENKKTFFQIQSQPKTKKHSRNSPQNPKNPRLNPKNPQNPVFHPVIFHQKPLFFSISRKKVTNRRKK